MIDRASRDQLALGLRRLASGQLTIGEYELLADLPRDDDAIDELWIFGWCYYSDDWDDNVVLRSRWALSKLQRRTIAQMVLFLKSDDEYIHGSAFRNQTILSWRFLYIVLGAVMLSIVVGSAFFTPWWLGTLLVLGGIYLTWIGLHVIDGMIERYRTQDPDSRLGFWPFANESRLREARRHPIFLSGSRSRQSA